jgi:hypothetical protein
MNAAVTQRAVPSAGGEVRRGGREQATQDREALRSAMDR